MTPTTDPMATLNSMAAQTDDVRANLKRSDAIASTLFAIVGVMFAFVAESMTGHGALADVAPLPIRLIAVAAELTLAAALLTLLFGVILPRFGTGGFRMYRTMSGEEIHRLFTEAAPETIERLAAKDLAVLSRIVDVKYRRIRQAVVLTGVAVTLLTIVATAMML